MGETTTISWCDHTFNPWIGCTKVSPACDGCYAEALMDKRYGRVEWGSGNDRKRTSASNWREPVRWNKRAVEAGMRPFVFCASLADVFDNEVDPSWRLDLFNLIDQTPQLVWLLLTKRIGNVERMAERLGRFPGNAAIGATMANQEEYDRDRMKLSRAKQNLAPAFTFGSFEPLLGLVILDKHAPDWIITGGETDQGGHPARPSNPEWFRKLRDQSRELGRAYHHKQNGEWASYDQVGAGGWEFTRERDGRRFGRLTDYYDGPSGCPLVGRELETRYPWGNGSNAPGPGPCMVRVGKNSSGRLLDRQEHNGRPPLPGSARHG